MPTRPKGEQKSARKNGKNTAKSGVSRGNESFQSASASAAGQTSARATVSGPARRAGPSGIVDPQTFKVAGTEAVARAMPFNQAKASEFGGAPPAAGQAVEPPDPMVSGSTLTETNASPKAGKGNPQMSFNPDQRAARSGSCGFRRAHAHDQPGRPRR